MDDYGRRERDAEREVQREGGQRGIKRHREA